MVIHRVVSNRCRILRHHEINMKFCLGIWNGETVSFFILKRSIRERAIPEQSPAGAPLAPAGWATMLFLRIGPVKHHLPSLNYPPLNRATPLITRFSRFAGKFNLPLSDGERCYTQPAAPPPRPPSPASILTNCAAGFRAQQRSLRL